MAPEASLFLLLLCASLVWQCAAFAQFGLHKPFYQDPRFGEARIFERRGNVVVMRLSNSSFPQPRPLTLSGVLVFPAGNGHSGEETADLFSAAEGVKINEPAVMTRLRSLVRFFSEELSIDGVRLRKMVATEPSLLRLSVESNLRPTVNFFVVELGITHERVRRMLQRHPSLLALSLHDGGKLRKTLSYFYDDLGLKRSAVKTMLIRQPSIMGSSIDNAFRPMAALLRADPAVGGLGLSQRELKVVVIREPSVLALSLESNVAPKIAAFRREVGATPAELRSAILASPNLLTCSLERRVLPRIATMREGGVMPRTVRRVFRLLMYSETNFARWLQTRLRTTLFLEELGVTARDLRLMRRRHRLLLSLSVATISRTAAFLRDGVGLSPPELRRVIVRFPQVLGCSPKALAAKRAFCVDGDNGLGLDDDGLRAVVLAQPSLLGLSVEGNLEPKVKLLCREMGATVAELRVAVLANPSLLEYSLERRIRPRLLSMREAGLPVRIGSVRQVCKLTDIAFDRWLVAARGGFVRHTAYVAPLGATPSAAAVDAAGVAAAGAALGGIEC